MELERLLEQEPWPEALDLLEQWQALPLLDRSFRTIHAARSGCTGPNIWVFPDALSALGSSGPVVAQRTGSWQASAMAAAVRELRDWLIDTPTVGALPSIWSTAIEQRGWPPEVVALVVTIKPKQWKPCCVGGAAGGGFKRHKRRVT